MFGIKSIVAAVTVATMVGSSAFAADGTLAPGKPAGVKSAQEFNHGTLIIGLVTVAVIAGIALTVADQSGDRNNAPGSLGTANTLGVSSSTTG